MKVAIVGGGVVGVATAHSLVEAGCDVVLLEVQDIPNPSSASCDLSRMMRVQYGPQSGYARLAKRALTEAHGVPSAAPWAAPACWRSGSLLHNLESAFLRLSETAR
jgi:glycine/D-amino acid oxidase-like deaminating enzyme